MWRTDGLTGLSYRIAWIQDCQSFQKEPEICQGPKESFPKKVFLLWVEVDIFLHFTNFKRNIH